MVILDTNILIDHLRRPKSTVSWFRRLVQDFGEKNLAISTFTIQELFADHNTRTREQLSTLERTLSKLRIADYDAPVAQKAGELRRDSQHELAFADAAIAATALHRRARLATLNRKDFENIPGLELIDLSTLSSMN